MIRITSALATITGFVIAQATQSESWVATLLQLGVAGVFLTLFATGRIAPASAVKEANARADRAMEETRVLNETVRKEVIPAITNAARVLAAVEEALRSTRHQ